MPQFICGFQCYPVFFRANSRIFLGEKLGFISTQSVGSNIAIICSSGRKTLGVFMKMRVPVSDNLILVPFAIDESMEKLIISAGRLALITGSRLHLMHVIRPPMGLNFSEGYNDDGVVGIIQSEFIRLTEAAFRLALEWLPDNISVSTSFVIDPSIAEAVMREANERSAALIMCGIADASHKYLPHGFSTVLSLMTHSNIPVLALHQDKHGLDKPDAIRLVIADDLQASGRSAARFAIDWASECNKMHITHVHVNTMRQEQFSASFLTKISPFHLPKVVPVDVEDLYEHHHASLQKKLDSRIAVADASYEDLKGRYETKLMVGKVVDEIVSVATSSSSDIIVFGRHQIFHGKSLGSVSCKMMLQMEYPILVVPSIESIDQYETRAVGR